MAPSSASDPTAAKAKLITDYLLLAQQMTTTAQSMTQYVTALAASPTHADTLSRLVPVPELPNVAGPFDSALADYSRDKPSSSKRKNAKLDDDDDNDRSVVRAGSIDPETGKKKRKKRGEGKVKDPNAPKRPMSAYLAWTGDNRASIKEQFPDLPYADLTKKMGEIWQTVSGSVKEEYQKRANALMSEWKDADAAYKASHGPVDADAKAAKPEKEKKEKPASSAKAKPASKAAPPAAPPAAAQSDDEDEESGSSDEEAASAEQPAKKQQKTSHPAAMDEDSDESDDSSEAPPPPPVKKHAAKPSAASTPAKSAPASVSKSSKKPKSEKK